MAGVAFSFNFSPGVALGTIAQAKRAFAAPNSPGLKRGFEDVGTLQLQFWRRRYLRLSKGGGAWKKLAPSTIARKGHDRIKMDTGRLYGSLLRSSPDCVFAVDKRGLTLGTLVPYGPPHETGNPNLPKRKTYVRADAPTLARQKQAMQIAVNEGMRQAVQRAKSKGGGGRAA